MKCRRLLPLAIIAVIFLIWLLNFYFGQIQLAQRLVTESDLPKHHANALQHAHAAARAYEGFRFVLPPDAAEDCVLMLGTMNEYLERLIGHGDDTGEVMKDYHNNQTGIMVGRALESNPHTATAEQLLVEMSSDGLLVHTPPYNEHGLPPDVGKARAWFKGNRANIRQRAWDWLEAKR